MTPGAPPQSGLSDAERLDWLRLIRSENVGAVTFNALLRRYGSAAAAIDALPELARKGGKRTIKVCLRADAEREIEATARAGARFIAAVEPGYPPGVLAIHDAPPLLTYFGKLA